MFENIQPCVLKNKREKIVNIHKKNIKIEHHNVSKMFPYSNAITVGARDIFQPMRSSVLQVEGVDVIDNSTAHLQNPQVIHYAGDRLHVLWVLADGLLPDKRQDVFSLTEN